MQHIIAPISRNDRGAALYSLQEGLILLLSAGRIPATDAERPILVEKLAQEQREEAFGPATSKAVAGFQQQQGVQTARGGEVDEVTAEAMNRQLAELGAFEPLRVDEFSVSGRVEFEDGTPAARWNVAVFDRDLGRRRTRLGAGQNSVTNAEGRFSPLHYRRGEFSQGEGRLGPSADLVFELTPAGGGAPASLVAVYRRFAAAGAVVERAVPDLILGFAAAPAEEVRIVVGGRPAEGVESEYERLMRALQPLLLDRLTPVDLDQENARDFDFAARETGWDRGLIETLSQSWRLAQAASRDPSRLAETFYGLLRDGAPAKVAPLPAALAELLERDFRWEAKLADSLTQRFVGGRVEDHLDRLRAWQLDASLQPAEGRRTTAGGILDRAGFSEDSRRTLISAYEAHRGSIEQFWREVAPAQTGWSADQIKQAQTALQFGDLLGYDLPLIQALQEGGVKKPSNLAQLDREQWIRYLTRVGPPAEAAGSTVEEKIARTADGIIGLVEATFPNEILGEVVRTSSDRELVAARGSLKRFFETEPGFDVRTTPVTAYLEEKGNRVYREMSDRERQLLKSQLQRLQRVYRLSTTRRQAEALLERGLDSALKIARHSREFFVQEFGEALGGPDAAGTTYARAESIAGTTAYLYADLWQGVHGFKTLSYTPAPTAANVFQPLQELPTYRELFGSENGCACSDCRSIFSPAAYFVDLLHLLDQPWVGANNPVEILFGRRPDLGQIQLTCENTNTLIPYIDLVAEILESFVANRVPKAFNEPPPPPNQILPAPLAEDLRVNPIPLTAASAGFADQAYAALQEAAYPLSLPLNLPLESARQYLGHLGLERPALMALLDRDPGLEALMARAAEILRLSPEEFEVVTGSRFGGASALRPATEAEVFGLSELDTPTLNPRTMFNHATPEFALNPAAPDPREALIRSLQNILVLRGAKLTVNGKYDAATEAAVNTYLVSKGLPSSGKTDAGFWGALDGDGLRPISVLLCPVSFFLARTQLSFEELTALVKSRFVNPTLQGESDFDYLARLGIPAADVSAWIQAGFPALPAPVAAALAAAGEPASEFTTWVQRRARAVVVNTGAVTPCDLDEMTLMHLDGTLLTVGELGRLLRFVRLWRKLGWTLAEMDLALEPGSLESAAVFSTILLLANLQQLRGLLDVPVADLVTLWQPIPTFGDKPVYDRLFRNRSALFLNPVLELNRERTELKAAAGPTAPALSEFAAPLLAAFRLTAQDLDRVRGASGLADDPMLPAAAQPRLKLATLSTIYRRTMWARALELTVREMLALVDLSGLDVFERPDRFPTGQTVEFVRVVQRVRAAGLNPGELEYLCRGVPQPPALPGTQGQAWRQTLLLLLDGFGTLSAEEPLADDSSGEQLTARLTPLLGAEEAESTTALLFGRDLYTASLAGFPPGFSFPASLAGRISYDPGRQQFKLQGALTSPDKAALLGAAGIPVPLLPDYQKAVESLHALPRAFAARALKPLFAAKEAEALLIEIPSLDPAGAPVTAAIAAKIDEVLRRRALERRRSLVKQTLSTTTGLSAAVTGLLLTNAAVLKSLDGLGAAISDYQNLEGDGLAAEYYANATLSGAPTLTRTEATVAFDWKGVAPGLGIPASGFSARWAGELYLPSSGEVTFQVRCSDGVRLRVNGVLVLDEWRDQPVTLFTSKVRLEGGLFYGVVLEFYSKTGTAIVELSWSSPSIAKGVVPQSVFYTETRLQELLLRIERVYKLAQLLAPFQLSAHELQLLSERGDLTLNALPLDKPSSLADAQASFRQWLGLGEFAGVRDRFPTGETALIDVPAAATPAERIRLFSVLTGATIATITGIIEALSVRVFLAGAWQTDVPDLTLLSSWARIADVLGMVEQSGAAPEQLLAWARTREVEELPTGPATLWFVWMARDAKAVDRSAQNRLLAQEARDLVRARYDEERWREPARQINDILREDRKAALIAYVLAMPEMMQARITDTGRLFEYFLIDAEMSACMETSRIAQGIASCQLFFQRILLSRELPAIPPSRVDRGRWEWMRSKVLWTANREVLFRAELYADEEFRDDKTPPCLELESDLLQDELKPANAEHAIRGYLERVDEVAKLIVCGVCIDREAWTMHIFGRTATLPFGFYHRRLVADAGLAWTEGVWSPWEKLAVDLTAVEDGVHTGIHLAPIAWNRRIYLFWAIFEQIADDAINAAQPDGFDQIYQWKIRLAWSEFKDGRWSPKQTGVPYVVSRASVERRETTEDKTSIYGVLKIVHPETTREEFTPPLGAWEPPPGHPNHDKFIKDNTKTVVVPATVEITPNRITGDPMLDGVVLEKDGDWASHRHSVRTETVCTLLPRPEDHYLSLKVQGNSLTLQVFCRYKGKGTGQTRTITEDIIAAVRDGRRTDRKEKTEDDAPASTGVLAVHGQVGEFHFPACRADLDAVSDYKPLNYWNLERPQDSMNSFMGFREDQPRQNGLRLSTGLEPVLRFVPDSFNVLDSDNRAGFDRLAPFFYQDQERCYLVTYELPQWIIPFDAAVTVQPKVSAAQKNLTLGLDALLNRSMSLAAAADLRANAWARQGLLQWAASGQAAARLVNRQDAELPIRLDALSKNELLISERVKETSYVKERERPAYRFTPHWHPYTCPLLAALNRGGLPGLYTLENQSRTDFKQISPPSPIFTNHFKTIYQPDPGQVIQPYPDETVQFERTGAYAKYNWELFFHIPLLIATSLSRAGKWEDALQYFHLFFDPFTADPDPSERRYWRFLPFRTADVTRLEDTVNLLSYTGTDPAKLEKRAELQAAIQEWMQNPFRPHVIARRRPVVFMKHAFYRYLDNLLEWTDARLRRFTREDLTEATHLLIMAASLCGPAEEHVAAPGTVAPETFQTLRTRLNILSDGLVDLETRLPFTQLTPPGTGAVGALAPLPQTLYFCIPPDDQLRKYRERIADRLFKIRHCQDIDGNLRELALFEPPIDARLLVEAVARGIDIGSVVDDLYAPLPRYRFTFMLQQAQKLCSEVRSFASLLLNVLEKHDAEELAGVRAGQEVHLLEQVRQTRKLQIDEAEQIRQSLDNALRAADGRIEYYENLLAQGLISEETDQLANLDLSDERQETASWIEATAQMLNLLPNVSSGKEMSVTFGGSNLGAATSSVARSYSYLSAAYAHKANRAAITGTQTRRAEDWRFQRDHSKRERRQIERQLAAAEIRREITKAELQSHETQIEHARAVDEFLRVKFTNQARYARLESTLRLNCYQVFKAAFALAKAAERCWSYECGAPANFIKFGAWDNSLRGLLAGEQLALQLAQMESAYLEFRVPQFEIVKHVSLAQLDPLALIALKENGVCEFELPEWLFDLDYPGHYFRRLKTVSLTIPAVVGPFTSLNATLTLLSSKVRESSQIKGAYEDDENFRIDHRPVEAIAASNGQEDNGRFTLDLRDVQYLPFEGAGAISRWRLELPRRFRSVDYDSFSSALFHVRYVSWRAEALVEPALNALQKALEAAADGPLFRLFSLRHEFPNEWHKLRSTPTRSSAFVIAQARFPFLVQDAKLQVVELHSALILKESRPTVGYKAVLTPGAGAALPLNWPGKPGRYRGNAQNVTVPVDPKPENNSWQIQLTAPAAAPDLDLIQDILLVVRYTAKF